MGYLKKQIARYGSVIGRVGGGGGYLWDKGYLEQVASRDIDLHCT